MSTKDTRKGGDATRTALRRHAKLTDAVLDAAGGIGGAAVGAAMGSIAGPPGAVAGAVIGGAIGAVSAAAIERAEHSHARHDALLDEEIGVTSEDLGARKADPPEPPKKST